MGVTASSLSSITTTYDVKFREGLTAIQASQPWQRLADTTQSKGRETTYPIKARSTRMREWVGERRILETAIYGYNLRNSKFEKTEAVYLDDLEDDSYGLYNSQMENLGRAAGALPFYEVVDKIKEGETSLCYDGQYFFDTDHPVDPLNSVATTFINLFTGRALSAANVNYVGTQMATLEDQNGDVLGIEPNTLIVPRNLRKLGEEITKGGLIIQHSGTDAAAPTNVMAGQLDLIVMPQLDAESATSWYLADLTQSVKPLVWQWRTKPIFQRVTDLNSEYVLTNDKLLFGAKARGAAGYGLPQMMAKAKA